MVVVFQPSQSDDCEDIGKFCNGCAMIMVLANYIESRGVIDNIERSMHIAFFNLSPISGILHGLQSNIYKTWFGYFIIRSRRWTHIDEKDVMFSS